MGKVKFSAAVSEIRNKVGGVVYSRNKYGAYMRGYVVPVNNNTPAQAAVRETFGEISASWKTLSNEQRSEWSSVAASLKKTDIFGSQYSSNGFQFYVQLNTERVLVGNTISAFPPEIVGIPQFSNIEVTFDYSTVDFTFNILSSNLTSNQALVIRATAPQSLGKTFFKNLYGVIAVVSDATNVPYNAFTDWVVKYATFEDNSRIGWQLYVVDKTTGLRSAPINGYVDVITTPYNPFAQAYFNELPTLPNSTILDAINAFYEAQQMNFVNYADKAFLFGMPYQDNTFIDMIHAAVNPATLIGSPNWVADKGYSGSIGNVINSQYNPATDGINWVLNDAWLAIWGNTNPSENTVDTGNYGATGSSFIQLHLSTTLFGQINANVYSTGITATVIGLTVVKLIGGTTLEIWFNGTMLSSNAATPSVIASLKLYICGNNGGGSPNLESSRQISHWAAGGGNIDVPSYTADLNTLATVLGW